MRSLARLCEYVCVFDGVVRALVVKHTQVYSRRQHFETMISYLFALHFIKNCTKRNTGRHNNISKKMNTSLYICVYMCVCVCVSYNKNAIIVRRRRYIKNNNVASERASKSSLFMFMLS